MKAERRKRAALAVLHARYRHRSVWSNPPPPPPSPACLLAFLRGRRGLVSTLAAITALSREFQYRGGAFNDEIRFPHSASFTMVIYARGSRSPKTPTLTLFPVYHYYRKRNDRERLRSPLDSSSDSRRRGEREREGRGGGEARNYFDVQPGARLSM